MTIRCAIIDLDTKTVENVIEYDAIPVGPPPGFDGNYIAVVDAAASPGWGWDGAKTFDLKPATVPVPAEQAVLSQDLMAQFTPDDAAKIQTAVSGNAQFWLLWSSLQAQKDPMIVTNARFLAGWNALLSVLGQARMNDIATALGVKVG